MQLTPGTVLALFHNQRSNPLITKPILQVMNAEKLVKSASEKERIKAYLSDGQFYIRAAFSTKFTGHFNNDTIKTNDLIKICAYEVRTRDQNVFIYVTDLEDFKKGEKLMGTPKNINDNKERATAEETLLNKDKLQNKDEMNKINNKKTKVEPNNDQAKKKFVSSYTPIISLTPFSNKWVIKGRCLSKSDIKKFTNQKGEGKLFSIYVVDESGSIKVSCFNETVDVFYEMFDVGKVYSISNGAVKMSNKKYSTATSEYEINLEKNSEIQLVYDETAPKFFFKFVRVQELVADVLIDFIGAVKSIGEVQQIVLKKDGSVTFKRDVVLIDETGNVRLTLWGSKTDAEIEVGDILALNAVSVKEFNGLNLSTLASSEIHRNLDIEESHVLKGWYEENGKNIKIIPRIQQESFSFISELQENKFATLFCHVSYLKEDNLYYNACEDCNRKVTKEEDIYRCEKCNKEFNDCNARYILRLQVADCTGQTYVSCFDKEGEALIGQPAKSLRDIDDSSQVQDWVKGVLYKDVIINVKKVQEFYNNEEKEKIVIRSVLDIDYIKESNRLLNEIRNSLN